MIMIKIGNKKRKKEREIERQTVEKTALQFSIVHFVSKMKSVKFSVKNENL